jgi:hypothetical protein
MAIFATTIDTQRSQTKGVIVSYSYSLLIFNPGPAALCGTAPLGLQRDFQIMED